MRPDGRRRRELLSELRRADRRARAAERRVVTVVFADLAGSTELAAMLDPERFRDVLAAFHGMVTDEITALGGRAESFIGDAVLGVFRRADAARRRCRTGVRAALAIVQRAGRIGAGWSFRCRCMCG